jgi:hypothetical protein
MVFQKGISAEVKGGSRGQYVVDQQQVLVGKISPIRLEGGAYIFEPRHAIFFRLGASEVLPFEGISVNGKGQDFGDSGGNFFCLIVSPLVPPPGVDGNGYDTR